jgi:hypothetical protein
MYGIQDKINQILRGAETIRTTPTPRTDALAYTAARQDGVWEVVPAVFARRLERELSEKTNEEQRLRNLLENMTQSPLLSNK